MLIRVGFLDSLRIPLIFTKTQCLEGWASRKGTELEAGSTEILGASCPLLG
jgi:hypothetical protein